MNVREETAAPADDAGDVEKTDEEIWNELTGAAPVDEPEKQEEDAPPEQEPDTSGPSEAAEDSPSEAADDVKQDADDVKQETDAERLKRLQHEVNSGQGRVSALQRKINRLQAENKRLKKKEEAGAKPDEERKAKLSKAVDEYGDALAPFVEEIDSLSELQKREAEDAKSQREMNEQEIAELFQEQSAVFLKEHPDGFEFLDKNADAFLGWIEDQPKAVRDMWDRNKDVLISGSEAAFLVSAYKAAQSKDVPADNPEKERLQKRREKQLEGAASPRSNPVKAHSSEPDDPEELFKYFVSQSKG